jgi:hypothetical protein
VNTLPQVAYDIRTKEVTQSKCRPERNINDSAGGADIKDVEGAKDVRGANVEGWSKETREGRFLSS